MVSFVAVLVKAPQNQTLSPKPHSKVQQKLQSDSPVYRGPESTREASPKSPVVLRGLGPPAVVQ